MNQITEILKQESSKQRTIAKANVITSSKRVRRSTVQETRNIWLVGSGNPSTPKKFYRVMYDKGLEELICDCKAFEFGTTVPCAHLFAVCLSEGITNTEHT